MVNMITDDNIKLPKKWIKHRPYFFTNTLDKNTGTLSSILDSYINSISQIAKPLTKKTDHFKSPRLSNLLRKKNSFLISKKMKPYLAMKTFPKIYKRNYQKKNQLDVPVIKSNPKFRTNVSLDRNYFRLKKKIKNLSLICSRFGELKLKIFKNNYFKKRKSLVRSKTYNVLLNTYSHLLLLKFTRFYYLRT
jgi:hypothetical protein